MVMSYLETVCQPLIEQLKYAKALPAHKLVGYAANFEFWIGEVEHCLSMIDGYPKRFEQFRKSQLTYFKAHKDDHVIKWQMKGSIAPIRRSTSNKQLVDLRKRLVTEASDWIDRCHSVGFIGSEQVKLAFQITRREK
jgi:tRNA A37 N6-isopentenylltransferase MiaA